MGWTFSYDGTRRDIIERRTRSETQSDGTRRECLRHAAVGNVLWTVWDVTPDNPAKPPYRFIGCDLLASGGKRMGWGYKDMCESMGPCYYSCPLPYLEMVSVADAAWREKVREYHVSRRRKVGVGDVLTFEGLSIPEVKIVEKRGRSLIGEYGGLRYRILPRFLPRVVAHHRFDANEKGAMSC